MGFVEAVRRCLALYLTFSGRARRSEFWWFYLATLLAGAAGALLDAALGTSALNPLVSLFLLPPTLAAGARRLHDVGRSGWWQAAMLPPIVLAGFAAAAPQFRWAALALLGVGIGLVLLVISWLARPGDPGPNRHGPPPG